MRDAIYGRPLREKEEVFNRNKCDKETFQNKIVTSFLCDLPRTALPTIRTGP